MPRKEKIKVADGKIVVETQAVEATTKEIPVRNLDRRIARATERKERAKAQLTGIQAKVDEWSNLESELKALRATISD